MLTEDRTRSRTWAALRQRCPVCRRGSIFRGSLTTNERCPVCGIVFEREEGYFVGAMYFSYALSIPLLALLFFGGMQLLPGWPDMAVAGLALAIFLPLVPLIFRYSRVLWIHYDRWAWPRG
jgi:uncharacterized protein (DUF983 family)